MTTARPQLLAEPRDVLGKHTARLRKAGKLPGVLFGHGIDSAPVTIDAHDFEQLRRHTGPNALIDVVVDGGKPSTVLVHGVQVHPVNRRPLHVDLMIVKMSEDLTVDVPVVAVGEATAVTKMGGTLLRAIDQIRVRARPDRLPQSVEISIEPLVDFETTLHVRDLSLPADVTLVTDPDEVLMKVLPPRVEEVFEVAPTEEEAAEGEAAEAPEGEAEGGAEPSGAAAESGES